jgi:integrase/recombinase XerD
VLRVCGKGTKIVLIPLPPAVSRPSTGQPLTAHTGRFCSTAAAAGWTARRHPPSAPARRNRSHPGRQGTPAHAPPHLRHHHARRSRRPQRRSDCRPARGPAHHDAIRQSPPEPRPPSRLHPRRLHGLRHMTPAHVSRSRCGRRTPLPMCGTCRKVRASLAIATKKINSLTVGLLPRMVLSYSL